MMLPIKSTGEGLHGIENLIQLQHMDQRRSDKKDAADPVGGPVADDAVVVLAPEDLSVEDPSLADLIADTLGDDVAESASASGLGDTASGVSSVTDDESDSDAEITDDSASSLSVDDLFGDVELGDAPVVLGDDTAEQLAHHQSKLERFRQDVIERRKSVADGSATARDVEQLEDDARAVIEAAADFIDKLPDRPDLADARRELVESYFRLRRLVLPDGPEETEARSGRRRRKKAAAVPSVKPRSKERLRLSRPMVMAIVLVMLVGARIAYYVYVESEPLQTPETEKVAISGGVVTREGSPIRSETDPPTGPIVQTIIFRQIDEGLQVRVIAISDTPTQLKYSYTWFEDGKIVAEENVGLLDKKHLKRGASYRAEIEVSDDSGRVLKKTEALVYRGDKKS